MNEMVIDQEEYLSFFIIYQPFLGYIQNTCERNVVQIFGTLFYCNNFLKILKIVI